MNTTKRVTCVVKSYSRFTLRAPYFDVQRRVAKIWHNSRQRHTKDVSINPNFLHCTHDFGPDQRTIILKRLTSVEQHRWFGSYPRHPGLCSSSAYVEKKAGLTCYNRSRPTPQHSTQHTCTQRTSTPSDVAWSTPSTLKKLPGLILSQPLDQSDRGSRVYRTLQGVTQSASVRNGNSAVRYVELARLLLLSRSRADCDAWFSLFYSVPLRK